MKVPQTTVADINKNSLFAYRFDAEKKWGAALKKLK